jgi:hypothetical protein
MDEKRFFRVFARLVEKVTSEPMDREVDFDWRGYFDSDMPAPSQKYCAELAAEDYLREYGYRHNLVADEVVRSVMTEFLS